MPSYVQSFDELLQIPPEKREYYFRAGHYKNQWKLHICLNPESDQYPSLDDPLVRGISEFLIDHKHHHKYANGGDGFNTFTIYTGNMEDNLALACQLKENFNFPRNKFEPTDLFLSNAISTRFEGQVQSDLFTRYGLNGIPFVSNRWSFDSKIAAKLKPADKKLLHTLAGHVFCADQYGENYLGKHYHKVQWDEGIFEPLSEKLSLDEIQSYINLATHNNIQNYINPDLKTDQPVILDLSALTGATNQPYNAHAKNTATIVKKMNRKPGFILDRHREIAQSGHVSDMVSRIKNKWQKTP